MCTRFSVKSTVSLKNFCSGKRNGLIKQGFPELSHTDLFYKEQILLFHVMWCVVMYLQFFVLVFPFFQHLSPRGGFKHTVSYL